MIIRNRLGGLIAVAAAAVAGPAAADTVPLPRPRPAVALPLATTLAPVAAAQRVPLPRHRPATTGDGLSAFAQAGLRGGLSALHAATPSLLRRTAMPFATASTATTSAADIAAVKRVLEFARKGKDADATSTENSIFDPLARKLAEYLILRSYNTNPSFERFAHFIAANPSWPHLPMLRRRAENALWNDKVDDGSVRGFFAAQPPTTAKGRFMLARALLAQGDRAGAEALVRQAWQNDEFSRDVEDKAIELFDGMITRADHKARMNRFLYRDDTEAGLRSAQRLGGGDLAIARARVAVTKKLGNAKALLDAIASEARHDAGYVFARVQLLRREEKTGEAAKVMLTAPTDPAEISDSDQWWAERRLLVRKALDDGDPQTAYRLASDAPVPPKSYYRVDQLFTSGWIALRFLHDPATAFGHFSRIPEGTTSPHALARAGYWLGRTAEDMGRNADAKTYYQAAAEHSATYYGQLARGRLGLPDVGLRPPPQFTPEERVALSQLEVVRAVEILYSLNERDLVAPIMAELGERATDVAGLAALGEVAARYADARGMVLLGQAAYSRGLPLDYYAFPTAGLPDYTPIGPPVEPAVAYSIARQESHFNQKVVSTANAMGFMQVTPAAGQDTAKRFGAVFNKARLLSDPVYNMQMGAGELAILIAGYRGSYILTFAGYNAGRGRIRQWIAAYGDPRDPKVDPVDWMERIPIAETRNYVQRIMENLQVYRARFGGGSKLMIEADLKRGHEAN